MDEELAIGIDLGTTFSCIAVLRNNMVEIIPNEEGENLTPSVVTFTDEGVLVGEQTLNQLIRNPKKTIYSIKRLMGRKFDDIEVSKDIQSKFWNYDIVKQESGNRPLIKIPKDNDIYDLYFPEQISKFILEKLIQSATNYLNQPIKKAVITVPAYFNDSQRSATKLAATQAGIEVLRIINEPTAASLAYGLDKKLSKDENSRLTTINSWNDSLYEPLNQKKFNEDEKDEEENEDEKLIIVFDLGGGTFDVTLLTIEGNETFEVLATSGDSHLGGDDFDKRIMDYCLQKFSSQLNINENEIRKDTRAMNRLKIASEKAKIKLSIDEEANIYLDDFYNKELLRIQLKRKDFEKLCEDLFKKLINPLDIVLKNAKKEYSEIKEFVFVGGSTRIPKIKELIHNYFFDININDSINPDEAVAYGAAIQAAKLMQQGNDILNDVILMDITPFSLGTDIINNSTNPEIRKRGRLMSVIIPKGTRIPTEKTQNYATTRDNQTIIPVGIYEGEEKYVKDNHLLGNFNLFDLPKKPAGKVNCNITFSIDENGILLATATETSIGIKESIKLINDKMIGENQIKDEINRSTIFLIIDNMNNNYNQITNYKKNINDYIRYYSESYSKEDKLKYISNLSKELILFINTFDKEGNDTLGNKYFLYIKALFESYNKKLKLNSILEQNEIDNIIYNCKYFLKLLSNFQNTNYKSYIELLYLFDIPLSKEEKEQSAKEEKLITDTRNNILFDLVTYSMELIEERAEIIQNMKLQLSQYNSKYLFQSCIQISELFIKSERELAKFHKINDRHNICLKRCKNEINKINANSLVEIGKTKNTGKLFENKNLKREELLILLDNFREALQNIKGANEYEYEAIIKANIVKINYKYLQSTNYSELIKMAEQSVSFGKSLKKDPEQMNWYFEIYNILEELKKKKEIKEKEIEDILDNMIKNERKYIFDEIKEYRKKTHLEFLEFILRKYPPLNSSFKMKTNIKDEWKKNPKKLILKLSRNYHPDHLGLKTNTLEEKLNYRIFQTISSELNSISSQIN